MTKSIEMTGPNPAPTRRVALGLLGEGMWGTAATYSFFLAAVMLSSWISGLGPGLMATVLGTLAADFFLIAPIHTVCCATRVRSPMIPG